MLIGSLKALAEPVEIANSTSEIAPIESIPLPDLSNDGFAEFGVLYLDNVTDKLRLQVIDGVSLQTSSEITWNSIFDNPSLHVLPDLNDNGVPEIGVFGVRNDGNNAGKPQLFARDLSTGQNARIYNWPANWTSVLPLIIDDITGDGLVDVAIQGRFKIGNRPQLVVRNGATGNSAGTFGYPDLFNTPEFFQHGDVNGDGVSEIATFGRIKRNNKIQIKLADGTNPSNRLSAYNFPDKWSNVQWIKLDDSNNDDIDDWALFGINKQDSRPQLIVKDGKSPRGALRIFAWSEDLSSPKFFVIPDMNNDGINDVAVGGVRSNGRYQFQVKDGLDRNASLANHNLNLNLIDVSFHVLDDMTADGISEIGFLGTDADNNYVLQVQNGNGIDGAVTQYNLGSQWSMKPSLKNIQDINLDGLTEMLVEGTFSTQSKMQIWAIPDTDNDSYPDTVDAFPADGTEWLDTDKDAIGNNLDNDDDNDGVIDENDAYPLISIIGFIDTDGDGIPDDCNEECTLLGMIADEDDDGNGIADIEEIRLLFDDVNLANCANQTAIDNNWLRAEQITSLSCINQNISSTVGIEHLNALVTLDLSNNRISEIDLSGNNQLAAVNLNNNQLTNLDFAGNEMLINASLSNNPFSQETLDYLASATWIGNLNYVGLVNDKFITQWRVEAEQTIVLEIDPQLYSYDYQVDWGDGTITNDESQHTFSAEGVYTVKITGLFPYARFCSNNENTPVLLDVSQWGEIRWESMASSFSGCKELSITAFDIPDLTNVQNLEFMFWQATSFSSDISSWDVSAVTKMSWMFSGATSFNSDISGWDVSAVTDMSLMFERATSFSGDISDWDVSAVTKMSWMFKGATSFNSDLSDWDVRAVTNMGAMFSNTPNFNSDISDWDVSAVTDMNFMFERATSFNSDVSRWDVSAVTNMASMFQVATSFSGDISDWDVGAVTKMSWMFRSATSFNSDISGWDVSAVTDMSYMFSGASSFNSDISNWDVSAVTNMSRLFSSATNFNSDISAWNVYAVINMSGMFNEAITFNSDLSDWDVSNVKDMSSMFWDATSFNSDVSGWDVSAVNDMSLMFWGATSFNSELSGWDVSAVTNMVGMFREIITFNHDVSGWDVSAVTNMSEMFYDATSFNGDISRWDVSAVTDMSFLFKGATNFNGDISGWNVSAVTNMLATFSDATSFSGDISGWDVSNVTNMQSMFFNAISFKSDISGWDVSAVTNMGGLFSINSSFNGDISGWDVSAVTNMSNLFNKASSFNGDISGWNVSNVTDMRYMFRDATIFNNDISGWDVSTVTDMREMFQNTNNFSRNLSGWNVDNVTLYDGFDDLATGGLTPPVWVH